MGFESMDNDRLVAGFIRLLNINSPSRKEGRIAEVLSAELRSMGFDVRMDDAGSKVGGDAGNIVATLPAAGSGGTRILLCAHMDTVGPTDGIRVIVEDGIVRQEGAAVLGADDKAGIAAILEGCRSVIESGEPHGQIQVVILVAEEVGLLGSKALDMSLVNSDLGYVFDSGQPVGHLVSEAPTHDSLMVEFTGRAANAGVCPEEGASAIVAASRAVSRMPLGRVDFETTANVGVISGGTARNIVPEKCEIKAEARSRDTGKLDRQVADMREALEGAARDTDCDLKIEVTREYLGYKHSSDIPLMQLALRAADTIGMQPDLVPHGGGSDCNILNAKGLPTAVIGVGYEKIHTPAEYIALSDLKRCAEYVAAIVRASGDA